MPRPKPRRRKPPKPRRLIIRDAGGEPEVIDSPWADLEAAELVRLWVSDGASKSPHALELANAVTSGSATPRQLAAVHKLALHFETGGTRRSHGL